MYFSKAILASFLALASSAIAQVVVTVTNTVTVVTVTVTPLSTSTYTAFVTVSGPPPQTTTFINGVPYTGPLNTITATATVTSNVPGNQPSTACPAPVYAQCGGQGWNGCTDCADGSHCKSSNQWYSQCAPGTVPVLTVTSTLYRG